MPSPAIPPIPRDQLPEDLKPLYDLGLERTGDATIIQVMAQQPCSSSEYLRQLAA